MPSTLAAASNAHATARASENCNVLFNVCRRCRRGSDLVKDTRASHVTVVSEVEHSLPVQVRRQIRLSFRVLIGQKLFRIGLCCCGHVKSEWTGHPVILAGLSWCAAAPACVLGAVVPLLIAAGADFFLLAPAESPVQALRTCLCLHRQPLRSRTLFPPPLVIFFTPHPPVFSCVGLL